VKPTLAAASPQYSVQALFSYRDAYSKRRACVVHHECSYVYGSHFCLNEYPRITFTLTLAFVRVSLLEVSTLTFTYELHELRLRKILYFCHQSRNLHPLTSSNMVSYRTTAKYQLVPTTGFSLAARHGVTSTLSGAIIGGFVRTCHLVNSIRNAGFAQRRAATYNWGLLHMQDAI
jgi:hypothetical protein